MADAKTLIDLLIAVVPPIITSGATIYTAALITSGLEKQRLKSQQDMEAQRLKSQQDMERQRVEYQQEMERQKQHMELYKVLYLERVTAAKKLMEVVTGTMELLFRCEVGPYPGDPKAEIEKAISQVGIAFNSGQWLFNESVSENVNEFGDRLTDYLFTYEEKEELDDSKRGEIFSTISDSSDTISESISEMMLNNDLSRLVKMPRQ